MITAPQGFPTHRPRRNLAGLTGPDEFAPLRQRRRRPTRPWQDKASNGQLDETAAHISVGPVQEHTQRTTRYSAINRVIKFLTPAERAANVRCAASMSTRPTSADRLLPRQASRALTESDQASSNEDCCGPAVARHLVDDDASGTVEVFVPVFRSSGGTRDHVDTSLKALSSMYSGACRGGQGGS